jgi:patatin-like phospholipase/acyl hydrolase
VTAETTPFRILSLDGGGVRGAYSAAVLAEIEDGTGKRIADHFDLIAGTSTGGIIAIALGLGLTARQILEFYQQHGEAIFPSTGVHHRAWAALRQLVAPKFEAAALDAALTSVFKDRKLGESRCRLVIPSYDAVAGDVHVFKTAHDARVLKDHTRRAAEVARATSAAPVYLPMFPSSWGQKFLDGGVWANCPSTVAVLEATGVLGIPLDRIELLSIGTTSEPFSVDKQGSGGGVFHYRLSVVDLLQQAQATGAWAQTKLLLRGREYRINAVVAPKRFALDDARRLEPLIALGLRDGRHHATAVAERFLLVPASPFVPWRPAELNRQRSTP